MERCAALRFALSRQTMLNPRVSVDSPGVFEPFMGCPTENPYLWRYLRKVWPTNDTSAGMNPADVSLRFRLMRLKVFVVL